MYIIHFPSSISHRIQSCLIKMVEGLMTIQPASLGCILRSHREMVDAVQTVYSGIYGVFFSALCLACFSMFCKLNIYFHVLLSCWLYFVNPTKTFSSHFMSAGSEVVVENAHIIIRRLIALVSYPHMMVRLGDFHI